MSTTGRRTIEGAVRPEDSPGAVVLVKHAIDQIVSPVNTVRHASSRNSMRRASESPRRPVILQNPRPMHPYVSPFCDNSVRTALTSSYSSEFLHHMAQRLEYPCIHTLFLGRTAYSRTQRGGICHGDECNRPT